MLTLEYFKWAVRQARLRRRNSLMPFGAHYTDQFSWGWTVDVGCCVQPMEWPPSLAYYSRLLSKVSS